MNKARSVNPSLYVVSDYSPSDEEERAGVVSRVGINAFSKQASKLMSPSDLTSLLWTSGGRPVAAVERLDVASVLGPADKMTSVIFDQAHDEGPVGFDRLLASAVIAMSYSPIASTRGYDDMLSFNPSVVSGRRRYQLGQGPFHAVRKVLNDLHGSIATHGMDEIMANYYGNVVSVFRCNSQTGNGVWCVFRFPGEATVEAIEYPSPVVALVMEARTLSWHPNDSWDLIVQGNADFFFNTSMDRLSSCSVSEGILELTDFPQGSVVIFETKARGDFAALKMAQVTYNFDPIMERLDSTFSCSGARMRRRLHEISGRTRWAMSTSVSTPVFNVS